ncbi:NADPH-dependent FMN reductase [Methanolacinia petrolearia DSM 11571]|uniref:NADPH-dependent FMN reductase n=1 Tax=Methanolacinia petrolearia (strain DSM 11571 / OCM 486 / SEBR 4847) TaxID=679926 RepID=E1RHG6_METP4|nr:NAD(P)H-dependent oxidoreductase [Methanolacinia petrolearia]ADN37549.1 NADPH-dependent FMN reductase [Methanolacinia petrolearia DSM 11571]
MKILAINGSPRTVGSTTRKLVRMVLDGAEEEAGAETEIIDICDFQVTPCTACDGCTLSGECVYNDDVPSVIERMKEADGIIFASPVYIDNVSGQMKVFFDRLADAIHYQILDGKFGCSVATTHTSGGEEVVSYLNHVLNYLGVISVGGISVATGGDAGELYNKEDEAASLGKKLAEAIASGYSDPVQEAEISENREFFRDIVIENGDFRTEDYERWVKKGWIE